MGSDHLGNLSVKRQRPGSSQRPLLKLSHHAQLSGRRAAITTDNEPKEYLLVDSCVGCHPSTGSETIVNLNRRQRLISGFGKSLQSGGC